MASTPQAETNGSYCSYTFVYVSPRSESVQASHACALSMLYAHPPRLPCYRWWRPLPCAETVLEVDQEQQQKAQTVANGIVRSFRSTRDQLKLSSRNGARAWTEATGAVQRCKPSDLRGSTVQLRGCIRGTAARTSLPTVMFLCCCWRHYVGVSALPRTSDEFETYLAEL